MMAHELPIPIHDNKKSHAEPIRKLPNGQLVDFGHNKTKKNNKNTKTNDKKKDKRISQNLPDGSKPVFNTNDSNTTTNTNTNNNNNSKKTKKKPEEVYAGSSFHSSPEALNLPKPSFKTSPKPSGNIANGSADNTTSGTTNGAPSHTISPPQYPVTAYPPGSGIPQPGMFPMNYQQPPSMNPMGVGLNQQSFIQPGFQYQFNSNGNIMYPNVAPGHAPGHGHGPGPQNQPPQGTPPMPHFVGQLPFAQQPPNGYPIYTSHYQNPTSSQGQKISFNDLLGSTKT